MPRVRKRVPKLHLSTAELRRAADAIVPLAEACAEHVTTVAVARARERTRGARRPGGRGSQLTPFEQLSVLMYASVIDGSAGEIAAAYGFNRKTVRRLLKSKRFEKFQAAVDAGVASAFAGSSLRPFRAVLGG